MFVTAAAAKRWGLAAKVMAGNFNHTGFNFKTMQPVDNGKWTEGDVAAGVGLLAVWAAHDAATNTTGGAEGALADALELADTALTFLEQQVKSPLYECVMPQGVLAAARMNAIGSTSGKKYNVSKMLSFALSDGDNQHRKGWGMMAGGTKWGGHDVGGLIGSITDGGGYAFLGNGLWTLAALSPVPTPGNRPVINGPQKQGQIEGVRSHDICMARSS